MIFVIKIRQLGGINMENLKDLTFVATLLGEDNEKRLRDGITDLLLQKVKEDLDDAYRYDYILAFDDIYKDVKEEIEEEFKEKLAKKYRQHMNKALKEMKFE